VSTGTFVGSSVYTIPSPFAAPHERVPFSSKCRIGSHSGGRNRCLLDVALLLEELVHTAGAGHDGLGSLCQNRGMGAYIGFAAVVSAAVFAVCSFVNLAQPVESSGEHWSEHVGLGALGCVFVSCTVLIGLAIVELIRGLI